MIETAKERIENEIKSVEKRLHRGRNDGKTYNTGVKEGLMIARAHVIDSVTTDKLSVEKLQEHLLPYKKEMVQKIIDEKMQLVTADEFLKLHKESLTAIRENDKLQEQLNTIKAALIVIRADIEEHNQIYDLSVDTALLLEGIDGIAFNALAAIGGDDE
ncbi:hypothetical protein [Lactococcus lactis]|uniref:hypothetical protein n=1 Tax=Lactococcus lactis TaxID=1358 RepID=UPI000E6C5637|nr:hypothetical protein [Lactococcus lactis]RJK91140.1 hypothetical protein D4M07_05820 [Lactococcus lactis subsp. lactis]